MHKSIDADYYGFRDEEDGVLLREEAEATKFAETQVRDLRARAAPGGWGGGADGDAGASGSDRAFVAHVLPEKEQIEALVLEKKKKICSRRRSEELQGQQGEAKAMLNKRA